MFYAKTTATYKGARKQFPSLTSILHRYARIRMERLSREDKYPGPAGTSYPTDAVYENAHRERPLEEVKSEIMSGLVAKPGDIEEVRETYDWYAASPGFNNESFSDFARRIAGIINAEGDTPTRSMNLFLASTVSSPAKVGTYHPSEQSGFLYHDQATALFSGLGYSLKGEVYDSLNIDAEPAEFLAIPYLYEGGNLPRGVGVWVANAYGLYEAHVAHTNDEIRQRYGDSYLHPLIMSFGVTDPELATALVDTVSCELEATWRLAELNSQLSEDAEPKYKSSFS